MNEKLLTPYQYAQLHERQHKQFETVKGQIKKSHEYVNYYPLRFFSMTAYNNYTDNLLKEKGYAWAMDHSELFKHQFCYSYN